MTTNAKTETMKIFFEKNIVTSAWIWEFLKYKFQENPIIFWVVIKVFSTNFSWRHMTIYDAGEFHIMCHKDL